MPGRRHRARAVCDVQWWGYLGGGSFRRGCGSDRWCRRLQQPAHWPGTLARPTRCKSAFWDPRQHGALVSGVLLALRRGAPEARATRSFHRSTDGRTVWFIRATEDGTTTTLPQAATWARVPRPYLTHKWLWAPIPSLGLHGGLSEGSAEMIVPQLATRLTVGW